MINLAVKEISHSWVRYVLTAAGLGLLIRVTLTMTGLVRGMMDDALSLARGTYAGLWVVQDDTVGPYAETSTLYDDVARSIQLGHPTGVIQSPANDQIVIGLGIDQTGRITVKGNLERVVGLDRVVDTQRGRARETVVP